MFKKQIIILMLLLIFLVFSGCNKKLEVSNEKFKNEVGEVVESVKSEELDVDDGKGEDEIKWSRYINKAFGFEMIIPDSFRKFNVGLGGITLAEAESFKKSHVDMLRSSAGPLFHIDIKYYTKKVIENSFELNDLDKLVFLENKNGVEYLLMEGNEYFQEEIIIKNMDDSKYFVVSTRFRSGEYQEGINNKIMENFKFIDIEDGEDIESEIIDIIDANES